MSTFNIIIGEINIVCTDAARSLAFYRDVLGFRVESDEEGCWHLACDDTRFLLLPVATARQDVPPYGTEPTFSIDLLVSDLDAALQHMQAHHVTILDDPSPNQQRFFMRDPDGLPIEVIQA